MKYIEWRKEHKERILGAKGIITEQAYANKLAIEEFNKLHAGTVNEKGSFDAPYLVVPRKPVVYA
jgi:hypothetical protein